MIDKVHLTAAEIAEARKAYAEHRAEAVMNNVYPMSVGDWMDMTRLLKAVEMVKEGKSVDSLD